MPTYTPPNYNEITRYWIRGAKQHGLPIAKVGDRETPMVYYGTIVEMARWWEDELNRQQKILRGQRGDAGDDDAEELALAYDGIVSPVKDLVRAADDSGALRWKKQLTADQAIAWWIVLDQLGRLFAEIDYSGLGRHVEMLARVPSPSYLNFIEPGTKPKGKMGGLAMLALLWLLAETLD